MTATRTRGITIGTDGRRFIDKRYHGIRIGMRVGAVTQEQAERQLEREISALISTSPGALIRARCSETAQLPTSPNRSTCAA